MYSSARLKLDCSKFRRLARQEKWIKKSLCARIGGDCVAKLSLMGLERFHEKNNWLEEEWCFLFIVIIKL